MPLSAKDAYLGLGNYYVAPAGITKGKRYLPYESSMVYYPNPQISSQVLANEVAAGKVQNIGLVLHPPGFTKPWTSPASANFAPSSYASAYHSNIDTNISIPSRTIISPSSSVSRPNIGVSGIIRSTPVSPTISRTGPPPNVVTPYHPPIDTTPPSSYVSPPSSGNAPPSASGLPPLESLWEEVRNEIERILTDIKGKVKL